MVTAWPGPFVGLNADYLREEGAAAMPWLFAPDRRPAGWDPHTFHLRDGTAPDDPVNELAGVVLEASRAAASLA